MSDMEKLLIGATVVTLAGLIVWLIQANFNDLKKRLDEIAERMVTKDICAEKHRGVNDKFKVQAEAIKQLEEG